MTEISDFQRGNLLKLADYLEKLPDDYKHFDMGDFHSELVNPVEYTRSCGAVACAIGHGPQAGIEPLTSDRDWLGYSRRALLPILHDAWVWCFDATWVFVDNSSHGAAQRIKWFLEKGLPENWEDQMLGGAPLCYKENV